MIVIMDKAEYHHACGEDLYSPADMNRGQCAEFLRQVNVNEMKGKCAKMKTFPASKFGADERAGGATTKVLRDDSHPDYNESVSQELAA